ncbi:MAG TPA: PilZ domain-containing protein [Terriglobales bacterium]|nr:PilZ domain-containing protein [Terriglobales bacterium]
MPEYNEKRRHDRFTCDGGVEVRSEATRGFWGTLTDVSEGGCYVTTFSPLASGTPVQFMVQCHGIEVRGEALVASMHPGVGMGLQFKHLEPQAQQNLTQLLETLDSQDAPPPSGLITK